MIENRMKNIFSAKTFRNVNEFFIKPFTIYHYRTSILSSSLMLKISEPMFDPEFIGYECMKCGKGI